MPQDISALPPAQQQRAIKLRSLLWLSVGTLIILMFSDPTVKVLSKVGRLTHIPSFFVSFILAPLATNAAEIFAAYTFAKK